MVNYLDEVATINEASLTGESIPVEKKQGENLMSGAINGDVSLHLKVTHLAVDSPLPTLVQLVQTIQRNTSKLCPDGG